jgi:intracellular sulfur oxidation DsrE/DsrF family protein
MKALKILFLSLLLASSFSQAGERKAMFDLTSGDAERIEQRIVGAIKILSNYYKKEGDEFKAVVVISGKSYKYFIKDLDNSPYKGDKELATAQKKLEPMLLELHEKYGVRFDMCGAGMRSRDIKAETLYSYVHTDKMKYVYIINWQNEGYAYVPI